MATEVEWCARNTSHIHPVNIAEGGNPPVHLVLQVEELGVRQVAQLSHLGPRSQSTGSRCGALAEDIVKTIVHCLGLQWKIFLKIL